MQNQTQKQKVCDVCGRDTAETKIIMHHLSYEPEILMPCCVRCHNAMHWVSQLPQVQREILFQLVLQYGGGWVDGTEKYKNSLWGRSLREGYIKQYTKVPENKDRLSEYHKQYAKTHQEEQRLYNREYRINNRKKLVQQQHEHYLNNKPRYLENNRRRYSTHRDEIRAYQNEWAKKDYRKKKQILMELLLFTYRYGESQIQEVKHNGN